MEVLAVTEDIFSTIDEGVLQEAMDGLSIDHPRDSTSSLLTVVEGKQKIQPKYLVFM
jgi:hypothetical protein